MKNKKMCKFIPFFIAKGRTNLVNLTNERFPIVKDLLRL